VRRDDELPDTPREPAFAPRPESLLPPRALPSFFGAGTLLTGAGTAALEIHDPLLRVAVLALCGVLSWLLGYITPPPRRHFRRNDRRQS
jgi:hypothetical protein